MMLHAGRTIRGNCSKIQRPAWGTRNMQRGHVTSAALLMMLVAWLQPAASAEGARHLPDILYARADDRALALDLHLPAGVSRPPLVVYLHGGAWREGSKAQYPEFLVTRGFAVASVDFTSS